MTLRPVLPLALAAALLVTGCSGDDSEPPTSATSASASTSPTDEPTPTEEATPAATCQVRKYVPGTSIIYTRPGPTVVVASLPVEVERGGIVSPGETQPGDVRIAATVTSGNGPLDPADESSILQTMGGPSSAAEIESTELSIPIAELGERGSWVAYKTAQVAHGKFRVKACGAPYNDGSSVEIVSGTYQALQKVSDTRVVRCDAEPADAGQAAAQRAGCGG